MTTVVVGGAGFIGRRFIPLLVERGEDVVCMDIAATNAFDSLGDKVKCIRGDVTQFDDVMGAVLAHKPQRLVNLSYFIGLLPAHQATKLNIVGMDNCFEAARLGNVGHTVFASSIAVSGKQARFGERPANEDDDRFGDTQYATCKIFNEHQAADYSDQYGMTITCIRPANVTGFDKIFGSIDHVNVVTHPARGQAISFPFKDAPRTPIHVDDMAEVFARVTMTDKPRHRIYNSGGVHITMGEIADIVREFIPDADISFEKETGGREIAENFLVDNSRLIEEFGVQYKPYRERVLQIINDVRTVDGKPPLKG